MIEELFEMHKRAKLEANLRLTEGDYQGYGRLMAFAFQCREFAADLMATTSPAV